MKVPKFLAWEEFNSSHLKNSPGQNPKNLMEALKSLSSRAQKRWTHQGSVQFQEPTYIHLNYPSARIASDSPFIGPEPCVPVSFSTLQKFIADREANKFKTYWRLVDSARQAKNCISINPKFTRYFLSLSKRNIKRLTDILTGHCALNNHLFAMGRSNNPYCDKCGDLETAEHFLCHCPAYMKARLKFLGSYRINHKTVWSIHPKHILSYLNNVININNCGYAQQAHRWPRCMVSSGFQPTYPISRNMADREKLSMGLIIGAEKSMLRS